MLNVIVRNNHIEQLDIVKALGIILVVIGHTDSPIEKVIFLFHMPLFFFVSGYLYNDHYTTVPFKIVIKRIKSLYIPFIVYGLLFGILHNCFFLLNIYSDKIQYTINTVRYFYSYRDCFINLLQILAFYKVEQLLSPFWFLPVLFTVNIAFSFLSYLILTKWKLKEYIRCLIIIVIAGAAFFYNPQGIQVFRMITISGVALLVFYFGYLFKKFEKYFSSNLYVYIPICLMCIFILWFNSRFDTINMAGNHFVNPSYFIISSLAGIYITFGMAKIIFKFAKENLRKTFIFLGQNTLFIMAFHQLCFKIVIYGQIKLYNYPIYKLGSFHVLDGQQGWWLVYSIVGILCPLIFLPIKTMITNCFKSGFQNIKRWWLYAHIY